MKKLFSLILVLSIVLSSMAFNVFASADDEAKPIVLWSEKDGNEIYEISFTGEALSFEITGEGIDGLLIPDAVSPVDITEYIAENGAISGKTYTVNVTTADGSDTVVVDTRFGGGTGVPGDEYKVGCFRHLNNVRAERAASFIQIADIDTGAEFSPIRNAVKNIVSSNGAFSGSYIGVPGANGELKEIKLNVLNAGVYYSVFGYATGATIKNIRVTGNVSVAEENRSNSSYNYIAGLCAFSGGNNLIENCENAADVTGAGYIGGIIGRAYTGDVIKSCKNSGDITATLQWVGGIAGNTYSTGVAIDDCANTGDIKSLFVASASAHACVGGIAGYTTGPVTGCVNEGTVEGQTPIGGISGYHYGNFEISDCTNKGDVKYSSTTDLTGYVGGIVGWLRSGSVSKCENAFSASVEVTRSTEKGGLSCGGIVGIAGVGVNVYDCKNYGKVAVPATATGSYTGGIVGNSSGNVYRCANYSDTLSGCFLGGILGRQAAGGLYDSFNTGDLVTTTVNSGGLVSRQDANGTVTNCFNLGSVPGVKSAALVYLNRGSLSSSYSVVSTAIVNAVTYEQTGKLSNTFYVINSTGSVSGATQHGTKITFSELIAMPEGLPEENWQVLEESENNKYLLPQLKSNPYGEAFAFPKENTSDYNGGSGTPEDPFVITNEIQFANISKNKSASYILDENITVSAPVPEFSGEFNGNGKTVTLAITGKADYSAMFGIVSGAVKIYNLTIDGEVSGANYVGTIAGSVQSSTVGSEISGIFVNENVVVQGVKYVGGIVGNVSEVTASKGNTIIKNCENNGDIKGTGAYIGGISGSNGYEIKGCTNNGNISGSSVGGITGFAVDSVTDCYNTGRIESISPNASSGAGGIAGHVRGAMANIARCYNTGIVIGVNASGICVSSAHVGASAGVIVIDDCFNAGAVIRNDGTEPVYAALNSDWKTDIGNVYYLTATAYDDGDENTVNITDDSKLADMNLEGFTSGGSYPVITANPQETCDAFAKVNISCDENGEFKLFGKNSLKEIFVKSGESVLIEVIPGEGYQGEVKAGENVLSTKIVSLSRVTTDAVSDDISIIITFTEREAEDSANIVIDRINSFIAEPIAEDEHYLVKSQYGYTIVKPLVNYGAVFSALNSYYGWNAVEYGVEINEKKYKSFTELTENGGFGILLQNAQKGMSFKVYAVYEEIKNSDNKITVYSAPVVFSE